MSGYRIIAQPIDIAYIYDGSLAGFYSCVHESVYAGALPITVQPTGQAELMLFATQYIETHTEKAMRVRNAIEKKISPRARELVETVFYSCMEEKERHILRFVLMGFREGKNVPYMMGHPQVAPLLQAETHLNRERHLLLGFVRFADYDGVLVATITPKNFILPFLASHFVDRYSQENFLIYDQTHSAALIYENGRQEIIKMEGLTLRPPSQEEQAYRALWKQFYNTIAIEARVNPKCRMTHMPKRYWGNMEEIKTLK